MTITNNKHFTYFENMKPVSRSICDAHSTEKPYSISQP